MHDLTCLLSGAAHCSLAAVSAALPCPGLPEERQLAEAHDHRTRHRPDSPSSRSQSEPHLSMMLSSVTVVAAAWVYVSAGARGCPLQHGVLASFILAPKLAFNVGVCA